LQRTLADVPQGKFRTVRCHGLHGTYDDGLAWLQSPSRTGRSRIIISLGSSIGNFAPTEARHFLQGFASVLQPSDALIVCLDGCQDSDRVYHAYNDSQGVTEQFYRNGLRNANKMLGLELFRQEDWKVTGFYNASAGKHEAWTEALTDVVQDPYTFVRGERIHLEDSYKYSHPQQLQLWEEAGLKLDTAFVDKSGTYRKFCGSLVASSSWRTAYKRNTVGVGCPCRCCVTAR
jgi:EasF-like predicted methyltransferase